VAEKILFLTAGNEDDDDVDDAQNAAFEIPDAVFGSHGFPMPTVAADGELTVPLISPWMWVGCNKVMKQMSQTSGEHYYAVKLFDFMWIAVVV